MTRVSLKEAYDNKDVVAQIYAIRDIAEGAEDNANSALSTANTASEHVDALVPQVEGAVQNANNASSSAQESAQTVAGYEDRLSNVELKITTVEGQILTIQGRITALETADGQNVKLTGEHAIGNYAVLLTGNQTKTGRLELTEVLTRSNTSAGQIALNVTGATGNCYVFTIRDSNNKSRGGMNHQTIMSGDQATRNILTLQSADYDTTAQTGAVGGLTLELLPTGKLVLKASVSTGAGGTASQTIATLQAA